MDQRERRGEPRIAQVGIEAGELRGGEHPLVDERAAGEARPVEGLAADPGGERGALDDPAEDEEPRFERRTVEADRRDEHLAHDRERRPGAVPQGIGGDRDVAPAEDAQAFGAAGLER